MQQVDTLKDGRDTGDGGWNELERLLGKDTSGT